ncbi:MAG: PASTA domain-containing protein [Gemmatimonadales bacterium]|nr:PASTA domain-containing protein [Gemmatimonadales bacterium]
MGRLGPGRRILVWLSGAVAAFVVGYIFAALVLFPAPIFAATIVVPRLLGMAQQDAEQTLTQAGLTVGTADFVAHPEVARGDVVWQDPPPGVAVTRGTPVDISLSGGPQRVPVPDLAGYDAALATQLILAAGLRVGYVDSTQAPVPKGVVVNTRPPAGTTLTPGRGITLVVSVGAPTITVPDLTGLTREDARDMLEQVGLTLGTAMRRTSNAGEPGTVIEQNPAPGTLSAPGTAVDITLARRGS